MSTSNKRAAIALALALTFLLSALTWVNVRAQGETPPQADSPAKCGQCHPEVYDAWYLGAHGAQQTAHMLSQQTRCTACHKEIPTLDTTGTPGIPGSDFMTTPGQPNNCELCHVTGYDPQTGGWKEDGITCLACHSPMPANHPDNPAPVHKETDMCRNCHTNDRFGWESWQTSAHYRNEMTCSLCHNPHTTSIKLKVGEKDASSLCENCHTAEAHNAQHSIHAKTGITCIGCHLGDPSGPDDFHKVPNHSFKPSVETCMKCHSTAMHTAPETVAAHTPTPEPPIVQATATATSTPAAAPLFLPPSPVQLAGMTALAGLIGGIALNAIRKRM